MNWTDEYREIVEFYYWEPQHIGRAKGEKRFKNADEMYEHINNMEVSLNHVLNLFFSLYPLHKLECFGADESHVMMSAWQLESLQREQKNATQPDMFFQGKSKNIAIELKTGSKSTLDQVVKYIKFNQALNDSSEKDFELIFLTPYSDMKKIFKEKYQTDQELHSSLKELGIEPPIISFISFDEFYKLLGVSKLHNEIEEKLVGGLVAYLGGRTDLKIA